MSRCPKFAETEAHYRKVRGIMLKERKGLPARPLNNEEYIANNKRLWMLQLGTFITSTIEAFARDPMAMQKVKLRMAYRKLQPPLTRAAGRFLCDKLKAKGYDCEIHTSPDVTGPRARQSSLVVRLDFTGKK